MGKDLKHRIEQRLAALNLSARAASLKAGGSPDLIRGLLRGRQESFRGGNLEKLAEALGVSVSWLLGDDQEHISSEEVAATLTPTQNKELEASSTLNIFKGTITGSVPEVDARAGAGNGSVGEHEVVALRRGATYVGHKVVSEWAFPPAFLRHELRLQPGGIMVLEVIGDSMSPSLESGDRVIIDTNHARINPDGIYVIDEGDGPMVKRLQMVRQSDPPMVRILSDNKNHEPYSLLIADVRIIGRVSGRVTKM